jgi:hypothetical protein
VALSREDFLKRRRTTVKEEVPGYGDVYILRLTQNEIARYLELAEAYEKKKTKKISSWILMAFCICDEDGKRLFVGSNKDRDEADYEAALELSTTLEQEAGTFMLRACLRNNGYHVEEPGKPAPENPIAETAKN